MRSKTRCFSTINAVVFLDAYLQPRQTLDSENYLLPLSIPYASSDDLSAADQEAIYCNIDETKK